MVAGLGPHPAEGHWVSERVKLIVSADASENVEGDMEIVLAPAGRRAEHRSQELIRFLQLASVASAGESVDKRKAVIVRAGLQSVRLAEVGQGAVMLAMLEA